MLTLNEEIINVIKNTYGKKKYIENPTCYFYNLKTIDENISRLKDNLPKQVDLYYAMKANNNKKIMERITKNDYVNGIEIASYGELLQALCYKSGDKILFTGPGKTEYELENSIKNKVKYINLESITEAVRIDRLAQKLGVNKVNVLIRII